MAVIKADAYGHGGVNVARLLRGRAKRFAVAIIEEALVLRDAGIVEPIVVLEGAHQPRECALAFQHNCILVMHTQQQLEWVRHCEPDRRPAIWLKVDTGMHRLGFAVDEIEHIVQAYHGILCEETVLATHLACADDEQSDATPEQLAAFSKVAAQFNFPVSIANSPATILWPQSRRGWNRLGVGLYGSQPTAGNVNIKPAMTLRSSVIALRTVPAGDSVGYGQTWTATRDSRIATVGIGYADGYPRHCPNGTPVVINGSKAELVGRVSMDMITIDVTDIPTVSIGDSVELWGENLSIDEVARHAGTISYELMTRISVRVPRIVRHR